MRILKVTQVYDPFLTLGGPALKVRAIAKHLAQRGHSITILTTSHGSEQPPGTKVQVGVEAIYLRPHLRYRMTTWSAAAAEFCRQRLDEFDVVHIYGLYDLLGPTVARFCRQAHMPYLVEPLGMFRPIDRNFLLKRVWHFLYGRELLHGAASVVATSEQEYGELQAYAFPTERLLLRYNGLDLADFAKLPALGSFRQKHNIPPKEPVVVFLGRLIPRKGADLLLDAFAQACPQRGVLVIAGPESDAVHAAQLRQRALALGLKNRVIFAGAVFGEAKKELLADTTVFALPSRYENFANAAAEAMACSTPVIVTDTCGISRLVRGRAGLVIPRSVDALVSALKQLLDDSALYERLRTGCREVAASLDWDRLLDPMERHYQALAARRTLADVPVEVR